MSAWPTLVGGGGVVVSGSTFAADNLSGSTFAADNLSGNGHFILSRV